MTNLGVDRLQKHSAATQAPRARLLERVRQALACPDCRQPLETRDGFQTHVECRRCKTTFRARSDRFEFSQVTSEEIASDWLNRIKEQFKQRLSRFYPLLIKILSPVQARPLVPNYLKTFDLDRHLVADLGSGTSRYQDRVVCVDGASYDNVHVVSRLEQLPFRTGSLDGVLSNAVLEHVTDPAAHVAEMYRVLKPGGRAFCYVPFICGFHASPHDYQRWTMKGLEHLFGAFEVVSVGPGSGPTSGLLWVLQEWLAMVGSFGSRRVYRLLVPLTWLLSPLKLLDLVLYRHPEAHVIACGHYIEARKPHAGRLAVASGRRPTE